MTIIDDITSNTTEDTTTCTMGQSWCSRETTSDKDGVVIHYSARIETAKPEAGRVHFPEFEITAFSNDPYYPGGFSGPLFCLDEDAPMTPAELKEYLTFMAGVLAAHSA